MLLAIGQDALGDQDGRPRWIRADLHEKSWPERVGTTVDAVLSSTALHWLSPPDLSAAYQATADLIRPGGALINADYLPLPAGSRLSAACEAVDRGRQQAAVDTGAEPWDDWWKAAAARPELAAALADRRTLWPDGSRGWSSPGLDFDRAALTAAGFTECEVVRQDLGERILAATR